MHRAECVDRRRYDPLRVVRVPQIGDQHLNPAGSAELGGCRVQDVGLDVDQEHRRTAFEQSGGDALAYALRGTGDDGDMTAHRVGVGIAGGEHFSHLTGPICSRTPRCIS